MLTFRKQNRTCDHTFYNLLTYLICECCYFSGGNIDGASKTLIGIATTPGYDLDQTLFLIAVSQG